MTPQALFDLSPRRQKVHKRVRDTSRAVYAEARERLTGRKAEVLRWLAWYWNRHQVSPTSAELMMAAPNAAAESCTDGPTFKDATGWMLYTRRGLSDLQTDGLVEAGEKRKCRVTGRTCVTWRVKSR